MKPIFAILGVIVATTCLASTGEKLPDAQIKRKLLGYWKSPRHGYLIKSTALCTCSRASTRRQRTGGMSGADVSTRMEVHVRL